MKKFNPFNKKSQEKFVPVGNEDTGVIYLLKRGVLVAKENPVEDQEQDRSQGKLIKIMRSVYREVAKVRGIPFNKVPELFQNRVVNGVEIVAEEEIEDWLSESQKDEYFSLIAQSATRRKRATTLFIRHRLGYHVEIAEAAKPRAGDLIVKPLFYPLAIGDTLKFGSVRVEVSQAAQPGDERVYINPLPQALEPGEIGFLLDPDTHKEKIGCLDKKAPQLSLAHAAEFASYLEQYGFNAIESQKVTRLLNKWLEEQTGWTSSDTDELEEGQINEVFGFYQSELGLDVEEEPTEEGKPQAEPTGTTQPSIDSSSPNLLTGSNAGSESSPTESQTQSLTLTTLETVPST